MTFGTRPHPQKLRRRAAAVGTSAGRRRLALCLEQLEPRHLLAGGVDDPWFWFESLEGVARVELDQLAAESDTRWSPVGPYDLVASEWIVQLSEEAIESVDSIGSIDQLLD
ncbi:MAG: hypothetical protein MI861_22840, partial [Pirellulales bacterium]|nr:hypothetical protein [Pirellulales bacterium]